MKISISIVAMLLISIIISLIHVCSCLMNGYGDIYICDVIEPYLLLIAEAYYEFLEFHFQEAVWMLLRVNERIAHRKQTSTYTSHLTHDRLWKVFIKGKIHWKTNSRYFPVCGNESMWKVKGGGALQMPTLRLKWIHTAQYSLVVKGEGGGVISIPLHSKR